ncbi:DUF58 domain-containing protein [Pseudomonas sp. nanlin1]|uniref:DUF58 domain-containing protein n=1 Tax=Pseudomonas sp. nanlin1 TaxID=3040605 RepID=UPI003890419E
MRPTRRLLAWLAVLALALLALGSTRALGVAVAPSLVAGAWSSLLALLALALLDWLSLKRIALPYGQRQLPGQLALGRWVEVTLSLRQDGPQALPVQVFDLLPDSLQAHETGQHLRLDPGQTSQLVYRLRALRRGHFQVQRCQVHCPSPLRLWQRCVDLAWVDDTHVYPDFARLPGAERMGVDDWLQGLGIRQPPRRGQGLEFQQLREFREGDSLRHIDWKATARQHKPIARAYQDDSDQQLVLLLDCGRNQSSQDGPLADFDYALNACLLLSYAALRMGDAVGLSTFATATPRHLAPAKGHAQMKALLHALHDLNSSTLAADLNAAAITLLKRQRRRAWVVVVTRLDEAQADRLVAITQRLGRHHRVLVASLGETPLEQTLAEPVDSPASALSYCATVEYLGQRAALRERLAHHGVAMLDAAPGNLGVALVNRYLSLKKAGSL